MNTRPDCIGSGLSRQGDRRRHYIYVIGLKDRAGVPGTLRRICPGGYHIQPMMDGAGELVTFWGTDHREPGFHVWTATTDGRTLTRLTEGPTVNGHPFWAKDDRRIVYVSTAGASDASDWQMARQFDLDQPASNIWIMDRDGGNRQRVTEGPYIDARPCVSPDGKEIVFVSTRSGALNLWCISLNDGRLWQVSDHPGLDYRPVFSPDGAALAYFTGQAPRGKHLLVVRPWPEGDPRVIGDERCMSWVHGPFWSADGKTILVHGVSPETEACRLWLVDVETGEVEMLKIPDLLMYAHGSWDRNETVLTFDSRSLIE